jgi:hypothetical protein
LWSKNKNFLSYRFCKESLQERVGKRKQSRGKRKSLFFASRLALSSFLDFKKDEIKLNYDESELKAFLRSLMAESGGRNGR